VSNPAPIVAPYVQTLASYSQYLTADEYNASGTGVDVSQLVPGGSDAQNLDALNTSILRASNWADVFCRQVLGATVDIQSGVYRVDANGLIVVYTNFTPIVQVNSISYGPTPANLASLQNFSNVWIGAKTVSFPFAGYTGPITPTAYFRADGKQYVNIEYVNGWANTLTTVDSDVDDTTLTVRSTLAFLPGLPVTIYDPGNTETAIVLSVSGNVITFTAPLLFDHTAGVNVSAMPPAIKEAVVQFTSAIIKLRGTGSYVMPSYLQQPTKEQLIQAGGLSDAQVAEGILLPFRRAA
jgi:hypothetical protein